MTRPFALALAVSLVLAGVAAAKPLPPPPGVPQRLAWADCVVVGKVVSIEEKTVKAPRFPGDKEQGEYQVAVIQVDEALRGAKGLTHVRVGFFPPGDTASRGRGAAQPL